MHKEMQYLLTCTNSIFLFPLSILCVLSLSISQLYSHTVATLHYARGIAHAVLGDTAAAAQDLSLLRLAAPRVPADHVLHNNLCSDMLAIAEHMLQGELHYREGELRKS